MPAFGVFHSLCLTPRLLLQRCQRRSQGFQWEENCKTTLLYHSTNHEDCLCHLQTNNMISLIPSTDCPFFVLCLVCPPSPSPYPASSPCPLCFTPSSSLIQQHTQCCIPLVPPPFPHTLPWLISRHQAVLKPLGMSDTIVIWHIFAFCFIAWFLTWDLIGIQHSELENEGRKEEMEDKE